MVVRGAFWSSLSIRGDAVYARGCDARIRRCFQRRGKFASGTGVIVGDGRTNAGRSEATERAGRVRAGRRGRDDVGSGGSERAVADAVQRAHWGCRPLQASPAAHEDDPVAVEHRQGGGRGRPPGAEEGAHDVRPDVTRGKSEGEGARARVVWYG